MENLIKKRKNGQYITILILIIIIVAILLLGINELIAQKDPKGEFNKLKSSEDIVSTDIYYMLGPVAEYKQGSTTKKECYIGIGKDDMFVVVTDKNSKIDVPIYSEDMTDEDINNLQPIKIVGKTEKIETELARYLINAYNEMSDKNKMTLANYSSVYGKYYIDTDTSDKGGEFAYVLFVIAVIFVVILIIYISAKGKENKKINKKIAEYKESGELEIFNEDIENAESKFNKRLKVLVTDKYIYNCAEDLYVIKIEEIVNAYTCCIIDNKISNSDYIAVETKDGTTYFIAAKPRDKKDKMFDKILGEIKEKIK